MKVLVTGMCGRLGRAFTQAACAAGHQVVGLDVVDWPTQRGNQPASAELIHGSYLDRDTLHRVLPGCEGLVHAGGPHGGTMDEFDTADFLDAHVGAVARMLDLGQRHQLRHVVLCSTMEVLIGRRWSASGAAFVDESTAPAVDSKYSLCRRTMEVMAEQYCRFNPGLSIASLRFMAFGYGDDRRAGLNLLSRTVPVADVASAVLAALTHGNLKGEVFNIGPKTPITGVDIGAALHDPAAVLDRYFPGATAFLQERGNAISSANFWPITSIRKAQLILGWEPQYCFETWLREQGWTPTAATANPVSAAAR